MGWIILTVKINVKNCLQMVYFFHFIMLYLQWLEL